MSLTRSNFLKWAAAGTVAAGALFAATSASARSDVSWSIGVGVPGVAVGVGAPAYYPAPAPVYVPQAPVYYAPPPPVYYRPPPVYYRPAPVYYGPRPITARAATTAATATGADLPHRL